MNKVPQRICQVLAITALSFGLAACDKNPSDKTPGQKLDTAIADTKQAAQDTGQAIQQGANQAGAKIAEGAQQAGAATGAALEQAGQKVEAAADKAGAALDDSGITALVKTRLIGDPDIKALLRVAAVWNIPVACNECSADYLLSSPLMSQPHDHRIPDYSAYLKGRV